MILVDTSVWIDHQRDGDDKLVHRLTDCRVLMHPFVLGELACGNLVNREKTLLTYTSVDRIRADSEIGRRAERKAQWEPSAWR